MESHFPSVNPVSLRVMICSRAKLNNLKTYIEDLKLIFNHKFASSSHPINSL